MDLENVFQKFSADREKLQGIFCRAQELLAALDLKSEAGALKDNQERLSSDAFKVLVVGEFKRGKSTFINTLLGEEVLPAYSIPCTAVINEIKYSEEKKAVLHFSNPLPKSLPGLAKDVQEHIKKDKGKASVPPMDIPVDRIEEFVVIPDPGKDQAESIAESPFSLVEIFWPIDLCKNRVEIIDSPGLNEHGTRTKVTKNYLSQADAVNFVLSCSALASQSELQVINDSIIASGHEEIFFVCNRFDEVRERERPKLMEYAKDRLMDKTSLGANGIHFLSALNALDAKIEHDETALGKSGFPELEKDLVSFLVNDRGHLKLRRPASALKRQIRKIVREVIPMQKGMLKNNLNDVMKQYEEEKPKLEEAERKRLLLREKILNQSTRIREYVRREVKSFISSLSKEIPDLVNQYKAESKITFLSLTNTKKQCENLSKELLTLLEADISKRQQEWSHSVLMPNLEDQIKAIYDSSQIDLVAFLNIIDEIHAGLSAGEVTSDQRDVPAWERITAAGAGFLFLSHGSVIQAGQDGFKGLAKSIIPQIGVAFLMGLLGLTNPLIFIPMLFATGGLSAFFSNKKCEEKLRSTLGQKVKEKMLESADSTAEEAVDKIGQALDGILEQFDAGMMGEIGSIKANVEKILQLKKEGEQKVQEHEQLLQMQQKTAEAIVDDLEEFIDELDNIPNG
jgi:GTPase SAR1 family protein